MVVSIAAKIQSIKLFKHQNNLLSFLSDKGILKCYVEELPDTFKDREVKKGEIYWVYDGPLDEKTRPFCKKLLQLDKVISQLDIDILTNYLGYDVLKYEGSYNCRHKWRRFRGKIILTPELTVGQIKDLSRRGIKG